MSIAEPTDQLQVRTVPYVLAKFQISAATLRRRIADGSFPAPFKISGARRLGWLERDLNAFLEAQTRRPVAISEAVQIEAHA